MVTSHEKKCQHFFRVATITTNDMVKFLRNVNFEETNTERITVKNDGS